MSGDVKISSRCVLKGKRTGRTIDEGMKVTEETPEIERIK